MANKNLYYFNSKYENISDEELIDELIDERGEIK